MTGTIKYCVKELEKHGFVIYPESPREGIRATKGNQVIVIRRYGFGMNDVATILVRNRDEKDDPQSDYFPGSYFKNIKKAICFCES